MKQVGVLVPRGTEFELRSLVLTKLLPQFNVELIKVDSHEVRTVLHEASHDFVGMCVAPSLSQQALGACDLSDGLAKETGSLSLVVYQYTGANSRMLIGFNTQVSGIVRATRLHLQNNIGRSIILGGRATAASALAALVQLKARPICVSPNDVGGPGSALAAAHRLGIDIVAYRCDDVVDHIADFDTFVIASPDVPEGLVHKIRSRHSFVIEVAPNAGGHGVLEAQRHSTTARVPSSFVPFRDVYVRQLEDDIRVLTGVNPNLRGIEEAVDNATG